MGHKIHPKGLRLGYTQDWQSRWFAPKNMPALIMEDFQIRQLVESRFVLAAVSAVGIERAGSFLRVNIHTARPGVVIGKKGADIETLRKDLEKLTGSKTFVNVIEIKSKAFSLRIIHMYQYLRSNKRESVLSKQERNIFEAILQEKSNKEICDELFISPRTVENYTSRLYAKIGVKSREELIERFK